MRVDLYRFGSKHNEVYVDKSRKRCYTVGDKKHFLPPINASNSKTYIAQPSVIFKPFKAITTLVFRYLKSTYDKRRRVLDKWPAYASQHDGSSATNVLTADKGMVLMKDHATKTLEISTKPPFLEDLDEYLRDELHRLRLTEMKPSELRLKVFGQVFDELIKNFTLYRTLLASIKNEYELMVRVQSSEIRRLLPLQQAISALSDKCAAEMKECTAKNSKMISDLKTNNWQQADRIQQLKDRKLLLEQDVERLKCDLSELYLKYRNARDQSKLLAADIAALKFTDSKIDLELSRTEEALAKARENPFGQN